MTKTNHLINNRKIRRILLAAAVTSLAVIPAIFRATPGGAQLRSTALGGYSKISPNLQNKLAETSDADSIRVILQLKSPARGGLNALLNRNGINVRGRYDGLGMIAVELPPSVLSELSSFSEVLSISNDDDLEALGHITNTTGAEQMRNTPVSVGTKLDGSGVGIVIMDSGLDAGHKAFKDYKKKSRILFSRDFTGENRTDDPFGHGTHVAAAAAGNGDAWQNKYTGIAANANIINLRVLNSQGTGSTSAVLAALDWVYQNRNNNTYNIKVVNMSLGTPAVNTYRTDPLCLAVRRLVDAGIVVVAAAGNNGKDANGQKQYGLIHSPGNEPSALTVGAANSYGTDSRADDTVASYSSRGPTRSYSIDANNVKHFDNLLKPEVVAPGNKVISAEAVTNRLVSAHPSLDTLLYPTANMKQMYLNGSSVAAPITAGAAALMLQANPKLTPNMVKVLLMYTAQQLPNYNTFEQGAGEINIDGAIKLAKLVRTDLTSSTPLGTPMLTGASPTPQSTIGGTTFGWARGIVTNHAIVTGSDLITYYQRPYAQGILVGDGFIDQSFWVEPNYAMVTRGILVGDGILVADGGPISNGDLFMSNGILVGDGGGMLPDGILVGDGIIMSDGWLVGNGVYANAVVLSQSFLVTGDQTSGMTP